MNVCPFHDTPSDAFYSVVAIFYAAIKSENEISDVHRAMIGAGNVVGRWT